MGASEREKENTRKVTNSKMVATRIEIGCVNRSERKKGRKRNEMKSYENYDANHMLCMFTRAIVIDIKNGF